MDEITNSGSTRWMDIGPINYSTASTDGTYTLNFTSDYTWDSPDNYYEWPKRVCDPSREFKYLPKWHILLGFKEQIKTMWN